MLQNGSLNQQQYTRVNLLAKKDTQLQFSFFGHQSGDLFSQKMQHVKTCLSAVEHRLLQQINSEKPAGYLEEYVRHLLVEMLLLHIVTPKT